MRTIKWDDLPFEAFEGEDGLFAVLGTITDPRERRGIRHKLQSVLTVALCATLAGARSFNAIYEWAADQSKELLTRIRCRRSIPPSERTIRRVLQSVDVEEIDSKMGKWIVGLNPLQERALALDGKTLRGSGEGKDGRAVHLLSAVVHGGGEVVAQTRVDMKTNEITQVAPLLEELDINGSVVTADALLTQRKIARHLVEDKQADYVFTVKNNQPTLRKDISDLFAAEEEDALRRKQKQAGKKPPEKEAFPPSARND